ncbi:hypothetical protein KY363_02790 [Candidatus Woesearchaeota archaeon]|nr:hypothetical protein [Candidatus Woesearchaeota archaeon]
MDKITREIYIKNVAIFLICLVILLPIHFSTAMAATINSVSTYGEYGAEGYRALDDSTTVNVSVSATDMANLSGSNVKVLEDPTKAFSCTATNTSGIYECVLSYAKSVVPSKYSVLSFTVQVYNDAGSAVSTPVKGSIVVDSLAPSIVSMDYVPKEGGVVIANFSVKDTACDDSTCSDKCAGVESLKFTVSGVSVGSNTSFDEECSQTGQVNLTGLVVSGDAATKHICVEAADKFGQSDTECEDVFVDAKAPEISGIGLFDSNGKQVTYTNGNPLSNLKLVINITEDSELLYPSTTYIENMILVNASELSERTEHQAYYSSLKPQCKQLTNTTYTCSVSSLYLVASSSKSISVRVTAKDAGENILNTTKSLSISFDNTGPVASKFYSDFVDDNGNYWLNETNNSLYLDITESGAGVANRNVFLDLSNLGTQKGITGTPGAAYPNNCSSSTSGTWTCKWVVYAYSKSTGDTWYAQLIGQSRDDANNILTTTTGTFYIDKSAPEVIGDINITAIGEMGESDIIASGDALEITALVEDNTPVKGYANLSRVLSGGGSENVESNCTEFSTDNETYAAIVDSMRVDSSKRLWECTWTTDAIIEVPKTQTSLNASTIIGFTFEDIFGHTSKEETHVDILGKENVTADYWEFSWEGQSPELGLDRFIWGLGQPVSYQKMKLYPSAAGSAVGARIVSFEFDPTTCVGDRDYLYYSESGKAGVTYMEFDTDWTDGIDDVILMEFNPTQVPPDTVVDENNVSSPLTNLTINCTATIRSVLQGVRISEAEEENFTLSVNVYGNPLGTNIGNVKEYMDEITSWVDNGWWGVVRYPRIILDYAGMICNIITTLNMILGIWTLITGSMASACKVSGYFCGPAGQASTQTGVQKTALSGMLGKFTIFCGLVISCRATQPQAIDGTENKGTDKAPDYQCKSSDTWCKVQLGWSNLNRMFVNAFSGAFITEQLGGHQINTATGGRNVEYTKMTLVAKSDLQGSFNPKKSLISSILTVCLPGIFSGIEKYRQLMCEWLMCYKVNIAYGSMTMYQCDELLKYGICRYVLGEIWNIIPFYQFANQLMKLVRDVAGNPTVLIGYAVDFACSKLCTSGDVSGGCAICTAMEFINVASQVAANIAGLVKGSTWSAPLDDVCKEALKDEPSYGNLPGYPPESDPATNAASAQSASGTTTTTATT